MDPGRAYATSSWDRASTLIVSSCTAPSLRSMAGTPPARASAPIRPCACSVSSRTSSGVSLSSGAGAGELATNVSVTGGTDTPAGQPGPKAAAPTAGPGLHDRGAVLRPRPRHVGQHAG